MVEPMEYKKYQKEPEDFGITETYCKISGDPYKFRAEIYSQMGYLTIDDGLDFLQAVLRLTVDKKIDTTRTNVIIDYKQGDLKVNESETIDNRSPEITPEPDPRTIKYKILPLIEKSRYKRVPMELYKNHFLNEGHRSWYS